MNAQLVHGEPITPESAGWAYSGLRVLTLESGGEETFETGDAEHLVVPLSGGCTVMCDGERFEIEGRHDVFSRVTDFAYVPRDATVTISSTDGARIALASARCDRRLAPRHAKAEDVPVELRGTGHCSRQVNNLASADSFDCDRLMVVEVLTPGGNWSSYPPHKHDEDRPGIESVLEEIYYFEVRGGAMAYQRVYGSSDLLAEVRTGDAITIPSGWHGPSMAVPGYDLYYLNVMAGPGERTWLICDDPAHAWVRATWADRPIDPRLPIASSTTRGVR